MRQFIVTVNTSRTASAEYKLNFYSREGQMFPVEFRYYSGKCKTPPSKITVFNCYSAVHIVLNAPIPILALFQNWSITAPGSRTLKPR